MADDLLSAVNQSVLQDRISAGRNQREAIRERLNNPGFYEAKSQTRTPITLENISQFYRPSHSLVNKAVQEQTGTSLNSSGLSGGEGEGARPSGNAQFGMNQSTANLIGSLASKAASGKMGPASSVLGSILSGVLGNEDPAGKVGRSLVGTTISYAAPPLGALLGLASLFGYDPISKAAKAMGLEGLMSAKDRADYNTEKYSGGQFGSVSDALDSLGSGYSIGDAPMSGTPSEGYQGQYGQYGGMYGDAPMSGTWGGGDYGGGSSSGLGGGYSGGDGLGGDGV